jgi:hypothetical protein
MCTLDVICQDILLAECVATNVTFILLNIGDLGFLTNFHVSGERGFIGISFVALLTNKLPDFVLRTCVPCINVTFVAAHSARKIS